jgi:two-component system cell cycle response regulator DivK
MFLIPKSDRGKLSSRLTEVNKQIMSKNQHQTAVRVNQNEEDFDWSQYTILIAEDEETNFVYLETALIRTKANIVRARNGKEAVEQVKVNPTIDIILMDIKMPEMNGLEATRSIKSFRKDVTIIAQTAFAMDEDKRNCTAVGCDDFLAKPIRYKVLLDTLAKYLR